MIKSRIDPQSKFCFTSVQYEDVLRKIKSLNISKASQQRNTPTKTLIENCEYFECYFHENINYSLDKSLLFLLNLKLADVKPVYEKNPNLLEIIIGHEPSGVINPMYIKVHLFWQNIFQQTM